MTLLLAADIGGTKTALALYELHSPSLTPLVSRRYASGDYHCLEDLIRHFLQGAPQRPVVASLGLAGVVRDNAAQITNLSWRVSGENLVREFGFSHVIMLNDMAAICAGIPLLAEDEQLSIQRGAVIKDGPVALIASGTGLGEGYMVGNRPYGSEGGHSDFAPVTDEQVQLLQWLQQTITSVGYETLCGGAGIARIYDFLKETSGLSETKRIAELLACAEDPTAVIGREAVTATPCPLCRKSVELYLAIVGAEAGNLALKINATGGLYIGGGIIPRLVGSVSFEGFLAAFHKKEKMRSFMEKIPVTLILKKDVALLGLAHHGRQCVVASSSV